MHPCTENSYNYMFVTKAKLQSVSFLFYLAIIELHWPTDDQFSFHPHEVYIVIWIYFDDGFGFSVSSF